MQQFYLYRDDFLGDPDLGGNPRDTENSASVVKYWFDRSARYAVEDIPDVRCLRLVAERLVVRRILGLGDLDVAYESRVTRVEVFGPGTPLFSELVMPSVFVALAFVPLTPPGENGNPRLARLYCINGLAQHVPMPLDGHDDPALRRFSWFLAGVPANEMERGVVGRSWLLAAHLLSRIVEKRDVATARNLATHFIVTGDVVGGHISRVEIGRKIELANRPCFHDFKWIIPEENTMNIPKRKIEKPATLADAHRLIESMQGVATESMFRFLRAADLAGTEQQYRNGADIYAREPTEHLVPMQIVEREIEKTIDKLMDSENQDVADRKEMQTHARRRMITLNGIKYWLQRQGADCALMFYQLAKLGNKNLLEQLRLIYPINAVDAHGFTAVDWALNEEEWEVASLLHSYGGSCNPRYWQHGCRQWHYGRTDSKQFEAIRTYVSDFDRNGFEVPNARRFLVKAIENGLSPEVRVRLPNYQYLGDKALDRTEFGVKFVGILGDDGIVPFTQENANEDGVRQKEHFCTLFGAAVLYCDYEVIDACLKAGAKVNEELEYCIAVNDGTEYQTSERGFPIAIVRSRKLPVRNGDTDEQFAKEKDRVIALLLEYGAEESK